MARSNDSWLPILTSRLIRYRLPRGIAFLLLVVVAVVVGSAYAYLSAALVELAGSRANTAALRLAASLTESARQAQVQMRRVAADTFVQKTLLADDSHSAGATREAAEKVLTPRIAASVVAVKLTDLAEHDVLVAGTWRNGVTIPSRPATFAADTAHDLAIGPFEASGDTVYYVTSFPVRSGEKIVGTMAELRRITGAGNAKVFEDLVGSGATLLIGDRTKKVWTNLDSAVVGPSLPAADSGLSDYTRADGSRRIGSAAPVARTPWIAWVEFPAQSILAPARRFVLMISAIAFLAVIGGGIGAWLFSRGIVGPLGEVSRAAEGIAAGDLSRRVATQGDDELGRLATSFNSMARQVEDAHHGLEHRVTERTAELEQAVAELHEAQEELVRKERLATLGQLAGSVGHELRNPLGVMTNSLYLLGMVAPADPPLLREYLDIIKGQVVLSEKIVGDLLDFARVKQPVREAFALTAVVTEQLARAGRSPNVTVDCQNPVDTPNAVGDRVQVGQIVLNLLTNAVQAVGDESGSITVRYTVVDGERVRLDVSDTGCGIPPANMAKVFDPLFTTKARGIGLGLSVSRQLARVNGGDIDVTSTVGVGSTFSLLLPIARAAA